MKVILVFLLALLADKVTHYLLAYSTAVIAVAADGRPSAISRIPTNTTESDTEDYEDSGESGSETTRCLQMIGKYVNGTFEGLEVTYDLAKILDTQGGPPGKVNVTWTEKEDAPVEKDDLEKRPLPQADQKYWLYKYGDTDAKTYLRSENAVSRFSGTPKAFTEIRGTIIFTPDDFCGQARRATYIMDDRGFSFQVSHHYCRIDAFFIICSLPPICFTDEEGNIADCKGPTKTSEF